MLPTTFAIYSSRNGSMNTNCTVAESFRLVESNCAPVMSSSAFADTSVNGPPNIHLPDVSLQRRLTASNYSDYYQNHLQHSHRSGFNFLSHPPVKATDELFYASFVPTTSHYHQSLTTSRSGPQVSFKPNKLKSSIATSAHRLAVASDNRISPKKLPGQDKNSNSATHQVRKERSRKAARNRRGRENIEFEQLANFLPFEQGISSQLDKASIVRLVISYLRLRAQTPHLLMVPSASKEETPMQKQKVDVLSNEFLYEKCHGIRALDGFMILFEIASPGRILYISKTVANFTGLALVDLIGHSIFEYLHPDDGAELAQKLKAMSVPLEDSLQTLDLSSMSSSSSSSSLCSDAAFFQDYETLLDIPIIFEARFKCTANKRGTYFKVPGYRIFQMVGRICRGARQTDGEFLLRRPLSGTLSGEMSSLHFVGTAIALPSISISEYCLLPDQIAFKLNPDMTIVEVDATTSSQSVNNYFSSLKYTSFFNFCHPSETEQLREAFKTYLAKSQAAISNFRILAENEILQGNLWLTAISMGSQPGASTGTKSPSDISNSVFSILAIFTPIALEKSNFSHFASYKLSAKEEALTPAHLKRQYPSGAPMLTSSHQMEVRHLYQLPYSSTTYCLSSAMTSNSAYPFTN